MSIDTEAETARLKAIYFAGQRDKNYRRMDRTFAVLMAVQWAAGVAIALVITPYSYVGRAASIHLHLYQAIFGGALLSSAPIALALLRPGHAVTRQTIAVAQMLWSALLIHLTGGRIETHFHVFGSLAFLAFYRDWKVLPTATVVVAMDHFLRGILAPQTVYGIVNPEWWRFLEHAFWVAFEDVVLVMSCLRGVQEMSETASRRAEAEVLANTLEVRVKERTEQLAESNAQLSESLERQQETQRQLLDASRRAGMADVATAVLHNVGNVLNSVNVSSGLIAETLRASKVSGLGRLSGLLAEPDVAPVVTAHPKTLQLPVYISRIGEALVAERETMLREVAGLQRNIEHIKVIVSMQQTHARGGKGAIEELLLKEVVEDALAMNAMSNDRHQVEVIRELEDVAPVLVDRHKVIQIVLNLLSNARHAVKSMAPGQRSIWVRVHQRAGQVSVVVEDSGCGIAPEHMKKLFSHGFTTREDGHGFGLHSSANAASELGGSLTCKSDGVGHGAVFTLRFPVSAAQAAA